MTDQIKTEFSNVHIHRVQAEAVISERYFLFPNMFLCVSEMLKPHHAVHT